MAALRALQDDSLLFVRVLRLSDGGTFNHYLDVALFTHHGCLPTNMHDYNVWLKSLHSYNGFVACCCLANQFHILVGCADLFENPADQGFIIVGSTRTNCRCYPITL